jgi:hypothetical protein
MFWYFNAILLNHFLERAQEGHVRNDGAHVAQDLLHLLLLLFFLDLYSAVRATKFSI